VGEPELLIRAIDEAVPMLGAVLDYGAIVAPLQAEWRRAESTEPERLKSRFGARVARLKNTAGGVEVSLAADASTPASGVGIETAEASGGGLGTDDEGRTAHRYDLAVVAEGGVFAGEAPSEAARRPPWRHDYRQTAWVGQVGFAPDAGPARPGMAFERFTRHGPAALLPLRDGRAALVWCVPSDDDPVLELDDTQRVIVLNTLFPPAAGRIASISPLQPFALGLQAERTLTTGRIVRIGNAAQTLHPVAGQGLNLGLRDAFELVRALMQRGGEVDAVLRRLEWQRGPDRWAMIAATDFLARSFTWKLPGAGPARGLGLAALQAIGPAKSAIARQMMFGSR
jgi:2-octaprenyl-6-methoxyphenol hydroxylase